MHVLSDGGRSAISTQLTGNAMKPVLACCSTAHRCMCLYTLLVVVPRGVLLLLCPGDSVQQGRPA
jgi:hypothetical protein